LEIIPDCVLVLPQRYTKEIPFKFIFAIFFTICVLCGHGNYKCNYLKTTINKEQTLFEFLLGQHPDSPRTRVKKLLQSGSVRVNSKPVTLHSFPLKPGDIVDFAGKPGIATKADLPFRVLFEDQHLIVIDKPAGINTSSVDGSSSIQWIISEFLKNISKGIVRTYVVHRLDKEVSGVLLLAKSESAMDIIKDKWEETEKHYFALVEGIPEKPEGTIKSWLKEDNAMKMFSADESSGGKLAITHYKIIRSMNNYSLLDIRTETGRKNQIRVHLSDLGCPIVGDRKYGASSDFIRRVRLHANSISFPHPVSGEMITVESEMPEGFLMLKPKDEKYK
jgi:23S rRNA pseudouridine1911/1915/1917 synthase